VKFAGRAEKNLGWRKGFIFHGTVMEESYGRGVRPGKSKSLHWKDPPGVDRLKKVWPRFRGGEVINHSC